MNPSVPAPAPRRTAVPAVVALPGAEALADALADRLARGAPPLPHGAVRVPLEHRRFPDGELYLRVLSEVQGREAIVVARLDRPDDKTLAAVFLADALRDLGAAGVGLLAPYLPYMRQDARFRPGEAITSWSYARVLSASFDWLVTVDPHLHRHASLAALYRLRPLVVASAPAIARWIVQHVEHPWLIGPDEESEQWVARVAAAAGCPHVVLRKRRDGDRQVVIDPAALPAGPAGTPVVVDDIISSAATMARVVGLLVGRGLPPPVCLGVHGLFAPGSIEALRAAGAARVAVCDTVPCAVPGVEVIGLMEDLAEGVKDALAGHVRGA